MSGFDALAESYDAGRIGYSNDIYDAIAAFGLRASSRVLDVGCGTGLASLPLAQNGFAVTGVDPSEPMLAKAREHMPSATLINARAESLPFPDASFDVALAAQTFHWLDKRAALDEVLRVLAPGGVAAIWWKNFTVSEPVAMLRSSVAAELGVELPPIGLTGGFREFYATGFARHALRVLPWRIVVSMEQLISYERSRRSIREALGGRADAFLERLEELIFERYRSGSVPLSYIQYLYLGVKA